MTRHADTAHELTLDDHRVTLRGPAELADALPYLLGYHPDDSVVLIGLHGPRGRLGGRIRTGIPEDPATWQGAAAQLAGCLVDGSRTRGGHPDAAVIYLCQEPADDGRAAETMERLRPLAQELRTACGALDVPVFEALYVTRRRYFSYCCGGGDCCSGEGNELPEPGTSPMAAAAAYAGIRAPGSLKQLQRRLDPIAEPEANRQLRALDAAAATLVPRMLEEGAEAAGVSSETLELAEDLLGRLRRSTAEGSSDASATDAGDDALLTAQEAARLVIGLQDRVTRDRAAEWMEGPDAPLALRLWRALARRCVHAFASHAAAPLTLAGWVAWSSGDDAAARIALSRALEADPEYVFAQLLQQALSDGLDPEPLRRCMRQQRAARGLR